MKKILLCALPLVLLAACKNTSDNQWTTDCEKFSSYDSREEKQCKDRIKANDPNPKAGMVVIDPKGTEETAAQDIGKGH